MYTNKELTVINFLFSNATAVGSFILKIISFNKIQFVAFILQQLMISIDDLKTFYFGKFLFSISSSI